MNGDDNVDTALDFIIVLAHDLNGYAGSRNMLLVPQTADDQNKSPGSDCMHYLPGQ